jgi:hypothetical protein
MRQQALRDGAHCLDVTHLPDHVPSGAALLAIALGEEARGIRGLDVLRRSVDPRAARLTLTQPLPAVPPP